MAPRTINRTRRVEYIDVDEIRPAKHNAKGHHPDLIRASLSRFGVIEISTMDERTGRLVHGHGRLDQLAALRDLVAAGEIDAETGQPFEVPEGVRIKGGRWLVPVLRGWASRDDTEAEAAGIALNETTIAGGWKSVDLVAALDRLQSKRGDAGMFGTGYTPARLEDLRKTLPNVHEHSREQVDDFDAEGELARARSRKAIAKVGDVWLLGPHRIICGDATDPAVVARVLDGASIDLVFTSPPYNVGVDYNDVSDREGADDKTFADDGSWEPYERLIVGIVSAFLPHLAPGRCVGWNVGVSPKTRPWWHATTIESLGLVMYRQLVWQKVGVAVPMFARTEASGTVRKFYPNFQHELVYVFSNGPINREGGPAIIDDRLTNDVFVVNQTMAARDLDNDPNGKLTGAGSRLDTRAKKEHPAVFPLDLVAPFVGMLCDRGAVVFDPFVGSGTTIIAAESMRSIGVGVELLPHYVDVACKRWQRRTGERPVNARTGRAANFDR